MAKNCYQCADCDGAILIPDSFFDPENCVANDVYLKDDYYVNKHTKFALCDKCFVERGKPKTQSREHGN